MHFHSKLPDVGTTIFTVMSALAVRTGAINLGQGFPDFDCEPALVDAVAAAMLRTLEEATAAVVKARRAEGAALHLERIRARADDFDLDVRDRLIAGAMIPAGWVVRAPKFRAWYRDAVARVFEDVDIILAPATPCRAPRIGQKNMTLDGVEMAVRANLGVYTQPISFIGLPVVAAPVWTPGEALPIGVQIIAPPWREDLALKVARALEREGVAAAPPARFAE